MSFLPRFASPEPFPSENAQISHILGSLDWDAARADRVEIQSASMINTIRTTKPSASDIETFLQNYPLSSTEGRALMTLAEALLRIPDAETADTLIAEKIGVSDWHKIGGPGLFGMATSMGLGAAKSMLSGFLSGVSKPVIRKATIETVGRLGAQFVVGEDIQSALKIAAKDKKPNLRPTLRMSFDMLGEGARTEQDAEIYYQSYLNAARIIGESNDTNLPMELRHGMSVKLSALHPRYTWQQADICVPVIVARVFELCKIAAQYGFTLTIDAEESERLEISLDIFAALAEKSELQGWNGLGLAVQAYDRRAHAVIDYIGDLARATGKIFQIRLVKGAYWDGEIKRAQTSGWGQYPVYTRKIFTDVSYLYAAQKLLSLRGTIRPMFATHNAATAAAILDLAGDDKTGFEFQRLFGMGQDLGEIIRQTHHIPVTLYAPVGSTTDLLPYLVRRMLENGANTSFVSQIRDENIHLQKLSCDVVAAATEKLDKANPLPLPSALYGNHRINSTGYDLSRSKNRNAFFASVPTHPKPPVRYQSSVSDYFMVAKSGFSEWNKTPTPTRADILRKAADILEQNTGTAISLLQSEGKKTVSDAIAEIREAVDFCRYYAAEGERQFLPQTLTGPTGEQNTLTLTGRGIFIAISPWNFPLAIFMGQVVAALMAGNAVIAKPAEQTPAIGTFAVDILHRAGVPKSALQCCEGDGKIGAELVSHPDVSGVVFTGSTQVAQSINRTLAQKNGAIVPLIAETGGLNAMIVDSTSLPEQVVDDVLLSAFGSAGQRCSALRVLYVQDDIADRIIHLLKGAIPLLKLGKPNDISTDIPPVIDAEALQNLKTHILYLGSFASLIAAAKLPDDADDTYFAPCAYEIDNLQRLQGEVFGPILHIIRFKSSDLHKIIGDINATGYGLTFGFHSRLESRHRLVAENIRAGNIYINRNMIGAVVGVQPFGGQGLSGTGPKAGGPHYLARFATEVTVTNNIMATGGNIDLLASLTE